MLHYLRAPLPTFVSLAANGGVLHPEPTVWPYVQKWQNPVPKGCWLSTVPAEPSAHILRGVLETPYDGSATSSCTEETAPRPPEPDPLAGQSTLKKGLSSLQPDLCPRCALLFSSHLPSHVLSYPHRVVAWGWEGHCKALRQKDQEGQDAEGPCKRASYLKKIMKRINLQWDAWRSERDCPINGIKTKRERTWRYRWEFFF